MEVKSEGGSGFEESKGVLKFELEVKLKVEMKLVKMEGGDLKRILIFFFDDDEDDEL